MLLKKNKACCKCVMLFFLLQSLLTVIGHILATHGPYKRSPDAHFKAFVCAGLNRRKLIPWLRLVLKNQNILEQYYAPWSYVVKTGIQCWKEHQVDLVTPLKDLWLDVRPSVASTFCISNYFF